MPVPIQCGLVEFVAGVRIRKRGNGCPARGVELVYFVTAVEDDVVCRWVEGETMRRNTGQQLVQCRLGSAKGDYPESSRGAAVGRGPIILLWGSRIRPLTVLVTLVPETSETINLNKTENCKVFRHRKPCSRHVLASESSTKSEDFRCFTLGTRREVKKCQKFRQRLFPRREAGRWSDKRRDTP